MTGLPSLSAAATTFRAVVVPPINSITTSIFGSLTSDSQSLVTKPLAKRAGRALRGLRTATPPSEKLTPSREPISAPLRAKPFTTPLPTVPHPTNPMFTFRISGAQRVTANPNRLNLILPATRLAKRRRRKMLSRCRG